MPWPIALRHGQAAMGMAQGAEARPIGLKAWNPGSGAWRTYQVARRPGPEALRPSPGHVPSVPISKAGFVCFQDKYLSRGFGLELLGD